MNKRVLTAVLAAERLGVSTRTIHRWAAGGFFPGAYKLNLAFKNSPLMLPKEEETESCFENPNVFKNSESLSLV
jgi:predicted DNA-binding transcriptional regulator YafY